ncbi:MAG TPA: SusC/RagA family TonB-linked outer membrane protein [Pricia antarctica]|uniref:SusC/RagA family TonB-linked outer membrane protein n=1 Tax=Pricia antarctica TaxID=641691 RepID=A0A831QUU9_9FLAO|nr:SusC/RagA family TonB-linked outer membrane protein [Pricia antarctica]
MSLKILIHHFSRIHSFGVVTAFLLLLSTSVFAQEIEIAGAVTDSQGAPLPGTSVLVKGTTNGTQTDFDGNYTITSNGNATLVFSYIGFSSQEVSVSNQTTINVVLEEDAQKLDEVVLTGYSTQNRSDMATSVSKLDTKVLESASRSNAATALQGTVAGVRITQTTGQPGSSPSISVRGGTNFDGTGSPLILVDGVPTDSFYALNGDDIESIEVLKDAASTAIYGARAADGVVLVTTKKGKIGTSSITYRQKYRVNNRRNRFEYLGAVDFINYNRQGIANTQRILGDDAFTVFRDGINGMGTGNNPIDSEYTTQFLTEENRYLLDFEGWKTIPDILDTSRTILFQENDMTELFFQNSYASDHTLSFQGGNEKGKYYLSLGYLDEKGLVFGSQFQRYSGTFNGSYDISDKVTINSNVFYAHSANNPNYLDNVNWVFQRAQGQPPTARIFNNNPDGSLSDNPNPGTNVSFGNPLYYNDKFVRNNLEQRLSTSVRLDWDMVDHLKFSLNGSHFTINNSNESFSRAYLDGGSLNTTRNATASQFREMKNQLTALLNYTNSFSGKHNLDALAGAEIYKENIYSLRAATRLSGSDEIPTLNAGSEADGVPSSSKAASSIISVFGQINYNYDSRFLVGLTLRRDGSSRLDNDKYGIFPGASVGWNLHNEAFYSDSKLSNVLSRIKPRISYGVNGKVESLGRYQVLGSYGETGIYDGLTGYANNGLPTPDLQWERSTTLNMGLDVGLYKGRFNLLADYFIRDVKDKISGLTLPFWTGFESITSNNGTLRNKGLELEFSAKVIAGENWQWNLGGTFYTFKNFVEKLPENENENNRQGGTQIWDADKEELVWVGGLQEGQRVGQDLVVAYSQDYIYANDAEVAEHIAREDVQLNDPTQRYPGDVAWNDTNSDNIIDFQDRVIVGRTVPNTTGGLTSNLTYKQFNLFVATDFALGHVIQNDNRVRGLAQVQGNQNGPVEILDSWSPQNTNTDVARFDFTDQQGNFKRGTDRLWEKGDYLALREVTLSYNFPTDEIFKDGLIESLRLYVTGANLHYFTDYSGNSIEVGGVNTGSFPLPVSYTLGLNITF